MPNTITHPSHTDTVARPVPRQAWAAPCEAAAPNSAHNNNNAISEIAPTNDTPPCRKASAS